MAKTIVFTREQAPCQAIRETLAKEGFTVAHLPLISCQPRQVSQHDLIGLADCDWVFFTSAMAVRYFMPFLPVTCRLASVGQETSRALLEQGRSLDFEAKGSGAKDFFQQWSSLYPKPQRIFVPQSNLASPWLRDQLLAVGHQVQALTLYDTVAHTLSLSNLSSYLKQDEVIWLFASPSAWQVFDREIKELPNGHQLAAIGQTTAQAIINSGYGVDFLPDQPSIVAILEQIIKKGAPHVF